MAKPSWGIVTTVDEPSALLITFAAWHLALGASEIHMFIDRPNPQAEAVLARLPGVRLTTTDDTYWAGSRFGKCPPRHTTRQMFNAGRVYRDCGVDWLLHCDADEFVVDAGQMLDALEAAPESTVFLNLGVRERVLRKGAGQDTIFDGVFRCPRPGYEEWGPEVYGRFAKFLQRGMSGHAVGKGIVRAGIKGLKMGIHFPDGYRDPVPGQIIRQPRQLYHFDGLTRLHFHLKLIRRLYLPPVKGNRNPHGINRGAQIRFAGNNKSNAREMVRLYEGTHMIDAEQFAQLDARHALETAPFDPTEKLAQFGLVPDLSTAAFDAELRLREAGLIARSGLPG